MSRNLVPRANKDADLGTAMKNWNRLYVDAIMLRNSDLKTTLDNKVNSSTLMAKGDLYVATAAGTVTRLPAGVDGYVLKSNSGATEGLMWGPAGARQELTENITVTVGNNGDFGTINAALENIVALYYPKYISGGNCPRVTINLLSGFEMSEQILVESLDLSWITITGNDTETVINRSALTKSFGDCYPAFAAINGGFLPIIGQLFNMNTTGTAADRHGILAYLNSQAIISEYCGVKNAGGNGIWARLGSIINAQSADASGAGNYGIYASNGSTINAYAADASGAGNYGIYAINSSTINAYAADASGAGVNGVYAFRASTIEAAQSTVLGAGTNGICAEEGSTIGAYEAIVSGAGVNGVYATQCSIIDATLANVSEAGTWGVCVERGSIIHALGIPSDMFSQAENTITGNGIIFKTTS